MLGIGQVQRVAAAQEKSAVQRFDGVAVKVPEPSDWQCRLFGVDGYVLRPEKGKEPNAFWRWMQFWAFGNRWERWP